MCSSCIDDDAEIYDEGPDDDDDTTSSGNSPNTLVETVNDYGKMSMIYTDHDSDTLEMRSDYYYDGQGGNLPVFLLISVQSGRECIVRVPHEVLLEMMDRLGMKLPEGVML